MVFGVSNAKYLAFDTPDENALTCANIDGEYLSSSLFMLYTTIQTWFKILYILY